RLRAWFSVKLLAPSSGAPISGGAVVCFAGVSARATAGTAITVMASVVKSLTTRLLQFVRWLWLAGASRAAQIQPINGWLRRIVPSSAMKCLDEFGAKQGSRQMPCIRSRTAKGNKRKAFEVLT